MAHIKFFKIFVLTVLLFMRVQFSDAGFPTFFADTQEHQELIVTAFEEAMIMARLTGLTLEVNCDPCKYFNLENLNFVRAVFRTLVNIPLDLPNQNAADVWPVINDPPQLDDIFSHLSISYGDHPLLIAEALAAWPGNCANGALSYLVNLDEDPPVALLALCPPLFIMYSSIHVTMAMPEVLGDQETDWLTSPAQMVLHELMHWPLFISTIPFYQSFIRPNANGVHIMTDSFGSSSGLTPPSAYRLRLLDTADLYEQSLNNADSFACYASVQSWSIFMNRVFGPATAATYLERYHAYYRANPPAQPSPPAQFTPMVHPLATRFTFTEGANDAEVDEYGDCITFGTKNQTECYIGPFPLKQGT